MGVKYKYVHWQFNWKCVVSNLNAVQQGSEFRTDKGTPSICSINVHPDFLCIT